MYHVGTYSYYIIHTSIMYLMYRCKNYIEYDLGLRATTILLIPNEIQLIKIK